WPLTPPDPPTAPPKPDPHHLLSVSPASPPKIPKPAPPLAPPLLFPFPCRRQPPKTHRAGKTPDSHSPFPPPHCRADPPAFFIPMARPIKSWSQASRASV